LRWEDAAGEKANNFGYLAAAEASV